MAGRGIWFIAAYKTVKVFSSETANQNSKFCQKWSLISANTAKMNWIVEEYGPKGYDQSPFFLTSDSICQDDSDGLMIEF